MVQVGIRNALAGEPQLEVMFYLSHEGILSIKAKERATGLTEQLSVKHASFVQSLIV